MKMFSRHGWLILLICLTGMMPIIAREPVILEEVLKPNGLAVGDRYIYVLEEPQILVFDRQSLKLVKRFGRQGEGPQEFKTSATGLMPMIMYPFQGKLVVNSGSKVSFYSGDGRYLNEVKVAPLSAYYPFGDGYISLGTVVNKSKSNKKVTVKVYLSIDLCDAKFNKITPLYQPGEPAAFNYPIPSYAFWGEEDKIFISSGKEDFLIMVFDQQGKPLYQIKKDFPPMEVTEAYKQQITDFFKNSPLTREYWKFYMKRIRFKKFFPAIRDMLVRDSRIYAFTCKKKDEATQCIVMDLKGKELNQVYLPFPESYGNFQYLYDVRDGYFFKLTEDEDEEVWQLEKIKIGN